jgi:nitroreductase
MKVSAEVKKIRKTGYKIDPLFINRWSPRAMSGKGLTDDELFSLFEAARWAPSSFNNQPWRFIFARKKSDKERFFNLLSEGNKPWNEKAAVLVVIVSKKTFDHNNNPSRTHSFDTGAAWENMALEGARRGLVVHGMQGFDYDKAKEVLKVPDDYDIEAMASIGKRGRKDDLPEKYREMEKPSGRKAIKDIVMEGEFRIV